MTVFALERMANGSATGGSAMDDVSHGPSTYSGLNGDGKPLTFEGSASYRCLCLPVGDVCHRPILTSGLPRPSALTQPGRAWRCTRSRRGNKTQSFVL